MYLIKKLAREYFIFHKQERQSLIAISVLTLSLLGLLILEKNCLGIILPDSLDLNYRMVLKEQAGNQKKHSKPIFEWSKNQKSPNNYKWIVNEMKPEDWMRAGLTPRQAQATFISIKKLGGINDLKSLKEIKYIPDFIFKKLSPFFIFTAQKTETKRFSLPKKQDIIVEKFDLNSMNPKGLRLSCRMDSNEIKNFLIYRKKLGGFYSCLQVNEVNGLDSVSKKILLELGLADTAFIRKIKLNHVSIRDLSSHPYFSHNMATAVVNYRYKHGSFQNVSDLLKLMVISPTHYNKIRPYLSIEP
jgi:hypothetical protein